MYFRILLLQFLLLLPYFLFAQRNISGIVLGKDSRERLPYADILIKGTKQGTSTNVDGYFSLLNAPEEAIVLQISYVGYANLELPIEAGSEDITELEIALSFDFELDEVVLTAQSYKVMNASDGISTIQVSPAQLALFPNIGEVDIFRSLQLLPGVSGSNESSSGLYVRGGTPDQNLVLLDGMTVYNVDHFFGFFSAFNAEAIKDVQLYKGAFPAKYGGRLSSVVDLTGKTGDPNKVHGNFGVNLLNAKAGIQIPLFKKATFSLHGRRSYTDIIQNELYKDIFGVFTQTENLPNIDGLEVTTIEPDFYFFDLNSKLSITPTKKDVLAFSFYSGADHLLESNDITIERGANPTILIDIDLDEQSDWGNRGFSGKWSRQWNPKWYSNLLFASSNYFSKYNRDLGILASIPENDTIVADRNIRTFEDNDVRDISLRFDNEWQLSPKHKLEFGTLLTEAKVDYEFVRDDTLSILDLQQEGRYAAVYLS
ncbi:MAG: carboxypeptidase-like regulatory domain-containing protein, partial [Bacteroidota bacterium]